MLGKVLVLNPLFIIMIILGIRYQQRVTNSSHLVVFISNGFFCIEELAVD